MSETIYITTEQNQNNASTLAHQGGGLVLTVGSTVISNGSEIYEVWTVTPALWVQNSQSFFTSYSEVEYMLTHTGILYKTPFISSDSFLFSFLENHNIETNSEVINFVAETLAKNRNLNILIY